MKTFRIRPDFAKMASLGITLDEIEEKIRKNNANFGAGRIERGDEALLVRLPGRMNSSREISNLVIKVDGGAIVRLSDIAEVSTAALTRYGYVTKDGKGEAVQGLVLGLKGADASRTVSHVKERLKEVEKSLPEGTSINIFYDRSDLIGKAVSMVQKSLTEAVLLVLVILLLFLGSFISAVTVAMILPLAILSSFILMYGCFDHNHRIYPSFDAAGARRETLRTRGAQYRLLALYEPVLKASFKAEKIIYALLLLLLAGTFYAFGHIGKTFMPTMDEGNIVIGIESPPSINIPAGIALNTEIQKKLMREVPEIKSIIARSGSDEIGLDPMGLNDTDTFLVFKPKSEWRKPDTEWLKEQMREVLEKIQGIEYSSRQGRCGASDQSGGKRSGDRDRIRRDEAVSDHRTRRLSSKEP